MNNLSLYLSGGPHQTSSSSASKRKKLKPANLQNVAPDPNNGTSQPEADPVTVNVEIPDDLKFVLVSDWDLLMHKKSLLVVKNDSVNVHFQRLPRVICFGCSTQAFFDILKKTQGQNNSSRFFRQLKQNHSKT